MPFSARWSFLLLPLQPSCITISKTILSTTFDLCLLFYDCCSPSVTQQHSSPTRRPSTLTTLLWLTYRGYASCSSRHSPPSRPSLFNYIPVLKLSYLKSYGFVPNSICAQVYLFQLRIQHSPPHSSPIFQILNWVNYSPDILPVGAWLCTL